MLLKINRKIINTLIASSLLIGSFVGSLSQLNASQGQLQLQKLLNASSINWGEINKMISANPQFLTVQNSKGRTALHLAMERRDLNIVKALTIQIAQLPSQDRTTYLNMKDHYDLTPFALAIVDISSGEIINTFISELGINEVAEHIANYRNKAKQTLLHLAVGVGKLRTVQGIIDILNASTGRNQGQKIGEIIKCRDKIGQTPLQLAKSLDESRNSSSEMKAIAEFLEKTEEEIKELENLKELLNASPINWEKINKIISANSKFLTIQNSKGQTALHLAVECSNLNIVEALITLMQQLPEKDIKASLKIEDFNRQTPLHLALELKNPDVANALITLMQQLQPKNKGALLYIRDSNDRQLLHLALEWGNLDVVNALIAFMKQLPEENIKALLMLENKARQTPLHLAVKLENVDVVNALLEQLSVEGIGTLISSNRPRQTPFLHLALELKNLDVASALITLMQQLQSKDIKALLKIGNSNRQTPLHLALEWGNLDVINALIVLMQQLPEKDIKTLLISENCAGQPPLQLAVKLGNVDVMNALLKHLPEKERQFYQKEFYLNNK
ncbi:MAG: ankyrin repeat domain-containing protein [Puniceicoccales bacterium]|jgi:ankyrin repeat protein|nr:ankyrin repeat domain-containing protein [Puniceicoccales bacterium]